MSWRVAAAPGSWHDTLRVGTAPPRPTQPTDEDTDEADRARPERARPVVDPDEAVRCRRRRRAPRRRRAGDPVAARRGRPAADVHRRAPVGRAGDPPA